MAAASVKFRVELLNQNTKHGELGGKQGSAGVEGVRGEWRTEAACITHCKVVRE